MSSSSSFSTFASTSDSDIHFEILSARPVPNPCRCRSCKRSGWGYKHPTPSEIKEFEKKTLTKLLEDCFINYNMDWRVRSYAQKRYHLAKEFFLRRMDIANRPRAQALRFIDYVRNNLTPDDDFYSIINTDVLDNWEKLLY